MSDIATCPFCGRQSGFPRVATPNERTALRHRVECVECGARGPKCANEPAAVDAWNKRTEPGSHGLVGDLYADELFAAYGDTDE